MVGKWLQYRRNYSNSQGSSHSAGSSYSETRGYTDSWGGSSSESGNSYNASSSRNTSKTTGTNNSHTTNDNHSDGASEVIDYLLQPAYFASSLRKGGRKNGYSVGGVIMTGGNMYSNDTPFLITNFPQK